MSVINDKAFIIADTIIYCICVYFRSLVAVICLFTLTLFYVLLKEFKFYFNNNIPLPFVPKIHVISGATTTILAIKIVIKIFIYLYFLFEKIVFILSHYFMYTYNCFTCLFILFCL